MLFSIAFFQFTSVQPADASFKTRFRCCIPFLNPSRLIDRVSATCFCIFFSVTVSPQSKERHCNTASLHCYPLIGHLSVTWWVHRSLLLVFAFQRIVWNPETSFSFFHDCFQLLLDTLTFNTVMYNTVFPWVIAGGHYFVFRSNRWRLIKGGGGIISNIAHWKCYVNVTRKPVTQPVLFNL